MARRSKAFAPVSPAAEVEGYFKSLEVVTFSLPSGKQDVFDFSKSSKIIGPVVGELGAALARVCATAARYTRKAYVYSLRAFFRYHADQYCGQKISVVDMDESYLLKYASWLRSQPHKLTTLDERYRTIVRLLEDIHSRTGSTVRIPRNQFPNVSRSKDPKRPLHPKETNALIRESKFAARKIWSEFESSRDGTDPELALVRQVALRNGGLLPAPSDEAFAPLTATLKRYSRAEGGHAETLERWRRSLYATSRSLIPFLILIMYDLAGNSEAIVEMERDDCLTPAPDVPILAGLTRVEWSKARSAARQYQYRGSGEFSAPSLIRRVIDMTDPLVQFMPPHLRNRLFLYCSRPDADGSRCHALGQTHATQRFKEFGRSIGLRPESGAKINLRFDMIRPTRLTLEYLKSGSIFRVNRLANHKYLTTSSRYVENLVTAERDAVVIADLQSKVLAVRRQPSARTSTVIDLPNTSNAVSRSFTCKDPFGGAERCPQWLKTLLDDSLVVPDESRYVARVWQARESLRVARNEIDERRFNAIYLDALLVAEDILNHFSAERLAEAQGLLPQLSPMPRLT